jgi:hypothetical protein
MTKKIATIRGMATGLAILMTCLYTACGGGNGADTPGPASFADETSDVLVADVGADDTSDVVVAAAGNGATAQAVGGRKSSALPAGQNRGEGPGNGTGMGSGTDTAQSLVAVDLSKIPPPGTGTSALKVSPTDEVAPLGGGHGAFRVPCNYSHMSFDDPIVYPGQPGRSHLHTFFGNTGANANSTAESIRDTGNSTCRGGIANRSSYWVPTLIDTRDDTPLKPDGFIAYYKTGQLLPAEVQPLPTGLRMVAGDPYARGPHLEVQSSRWKCIGGPNKENDLYQASIGNCDVGAKLTQEVFFPQCWDGVNLDSPDHRSHMSYRVSVTNPSGRGTHSECPQTHPVVLPQITFNVSYIVREKDAPLRWRLSSDTYDKSQPGGYSSHGDWFNGWKSDISDAFARNCLEAAKDCHAHLLGDGRMIHF